MLYPIELGVRVSEPFVRHAIIAKMGLIRKGGQAVARHGKKHR